MTRRAGIVVGIGVLGLLLAFWRIVLWPGLLHKRAVHHQMWEIGAAVIRYNDLYPHPPDSMEELVKSGLLPSTSNVYASTMHYRTLRPPQIHFTESDYLIRRSNDVVFINLQDDVYQKIRSNWDLRWVEASTLSHRVDYGDTRYKLRPRHRMF
jgi:hypothetical protein